MKRSWGISPIRPASSSPATGQFRIRLPKLSSPISPMMIFKASVTARINRAMLTVWRRADFTMLCSQSQCSCSQILWMFDPIFLWLYFRNTKSARKPARIPITAFMARIRPMVPRGAWLEMRMGSISSEVDKKTASSVPSVITLPEKKLAAAAEKPHWGISPSTPPRRGPHFPALRIIPFVLSLVRCSMYSISRYVTNKKGRVFKVSITQSRIKSVILFLLSVCLNYAPAEGFHTGVRRFL